MAKDLVWTPAARADLQAIELYLRGVEPDGAASIVERIEDAALRTLNPRFRGNQVRELGDPGLRQIQVMSWRLLYRIEGERIRVVGVVHGRQLLGNVEHGFEESAQAAYVPA